jgi:hypothetical protein
MFRLLSSLAGLPAFFLLSLSTANAAPETCSEGLSGVYASFSQATATSGTGSFSLPSDRVAVLPDFTWEGSGTIQYINVGTDEPFGGGNSMVTVYGSAKNASNLNIRTKTNSVAPGNPITKKITVTIRFDQPTPPSGWGFSLVDLDVDQVRFRAKNASGVSVSRATMATWFIQTFDASPVVNGLNIPSWDPAEVAVVGSESTTSTWRTTIDTSSGDTEAGAAWFQPNVSLSEMTFEYQSIVQTGAPSFHLIIAACQSAYVSGTPTPDPGVTATPTPTPVGTADTDGDAIPDNREGTEDTDGDGLPNYLDQDSDGDTVPDDVEGVEDADGDGSPNSLDRDSDGDGVGDAIERDPTGPEPTPSGVDSNNDGIDDGMSSETDSPLTDSDGDGAPDASDTDSDNDDVGDMTEAFDLNGDGVADVAPSGRDSNKNGIDDAFDDLQDADKLNLSYTGKRSSAPCDTVRISTKKAVVSRRMNALYARVPKFAKRAAACGGAYQASLVKGATITRRAFERHLAAAFKDAELRCSRNICPKVSLSSDRVALNAMAESLFKSAKRAKLNAVQVCGHTPSGKPDNRPQTIRYLEQLRADIAKLPRTVSRCG